MTAEIKEITITGEVSKRMKRIFIGTHMIE